MVHSQLPHLYCPCHPPAYALCVPCVSPSCGQSAHLPAELALSHPVAESARSRAPAAAGRWQIEQLQVGVQWHDQWDQQPACGQICDAWGVPSPCVCRAAALLLAAQRRLCPGSWAAAAAAANLQMQAITLNGQNTNEHDSYCLSLPGW